MLPFLGSSKDITYDTMFFRSCFKREINFKIRIDSCVNTSIYFLVLSIEFSMAFVNMEIEQKWKKITD